METTLEFNMDILNETVTEDIKPIELPPITKRWEDLSRWVLDIETTGTDPSQDRILAVGLLRGDKKVALFDDHNERDILHRLFSTLRRFAPDVLAGHNIMEFDIPFINTRAEHHGLVSPLRIGKGELTVGGAKSPKGDVLRYTPVQTEWGGAVVDTMHLVCRWDFIHNELPDYTLKSSAEFLLKKTRAVKLSHTAIHRAFYENRELFNAYLVEDLRDTMGLLEMLAPPYFFLHCIVPNLPLDRAFTAGTSVVWDRIYTSYYPTRPEPDPKSTYVGGLTLRRKGLFRNCAKVDVSSMYPNIMLRYNIHSRKDPDRIALRWLAALTARRLELKSRVKAGDEAAKHEEAALKALINSAYGYLGAGVEEGKENVGFAFFNDCQAAERVTHIGRTMLAAMVEAIENTGGVVVECDTDGVVFSAADVQRCYQAAQDALPEGFSLSLEWTDRIVYTPKAKNYIVLDAQGNVISRKGIYRKRDKSRLARDFPVMFIQRLVQEGYQSARQFAESVAASIASGDGWDWVMVNRRVRANEKKLREMGYKPGECALVAKTRDGYTTGDKPYDTRLYLKELQDILNEILETLEGTGGDNDGNDGE